MLKLRCSELPSHLCATGWFSIWLLIFSYKTVNDYLCRCNVVILLRCVTVTCINLVRLSQIYIYVYSNYIDWIKMFCGFQRVCCRMIFFLIMVICCLQAIDNRSVWVIRYNQFPLTCFLLTLDVEWASLRVKTLGLLKWEVELGLHGFHRAQTWWGASITPLFNLLAFKLSVFHHVKLSTYRC